MASKIIYAQSGHTMHTADITKAEFEAALPNVNADSYTHYYVVRNWDAIGPVFMYMAKGYHAPHVNTRKVASEIHVWYRNSKAMWSGMGYNFKDAIDGAQRDGWLCA